MGGPTFFNKRYDTVHIYKRGIHYTSIDDKEKFSISTGSFTPPLDILSGWIDKYKQSNQFTVLVLWHPITENRAIDLESTQKIDCLPNYLPWGGFSKKK